MLALKDSSEQENHLNPAILLFQLGGKVVYTKLPTLSHLGNAMGGPLVVPHFLSSTPTPFIQFYPIELGIFPVLIALTNMWQLLVHWLHMVPVSTTLNY